MKKLLSVCALILAITTSSFAQQNDLQDVVYLKNGSIIRGVIIEQIPSKSLKIKTSDGNVFVYSVDEVSKMTKEESLQKYNSNAKVSYQGEILIGYSAGIGTVPYDRISIHTIQGVKVVEDLSMGIGLGLDFIPDLGGYPELTLPFYLNTKGYLPMSDKCKLFLSVDIGVSVGVTEGVSGLSGFLFVPAIGFNTKISPRNSINISLGYNSQAWSEMGVSVNTNAMTLRVGFQF